MKKSKLKQTAIDLSPIAVVVVIAVITLLAAFEPFHTPKFKPGDCISVILEETEFEPARLGGSQKLILKVGTKHYLLREYLDVTGTSEILYVDRYYAKVECKKETP